VPHHSRSGTVHLGEPHCCATMAAGSPVGHAKDTRCNNVQGRICSGDCSNRVVEKAWRRVCGFGFGFGVVTDGTHVSARECCRWNRSPTKSLTADYSGPAGRAAPQLAGPLHALAIHFSIIAPFSLQLHVRQIRMKRTVQVLLILFQGN
jgi:hypothetical protein